MKGSNILYIILIISILFILSSCNKQNDKEMSYNVSSSAEFSTADEDSSEQEVTFDEKVSGRIEDSSVEDSSESVVDNDTVSSNENNSAGSSSDSSGSTKPYNSSSGDSENSVANPGNSSVGASANAGSSESGNSASGSTSKPTQAAKPVQPATSAPKPTTASKPVQPQTKAPVWHEPVYNTVPVWVETKAAWTEEVKTEKQVPIYKNVDYIICVCGFETTDLNASKEHGYNHIRNDEPEATRVETRSEIIGYETQCEITYIDHPAEGYWSEKQILVQEGYWE